MQPLPYSLAQCIDHLGPVSRARYADLKALVSDATALQNALMERMGAAHEEFRRLQYSLARVSVPGGDADQAKELAEELAAVSRKLDKLERERSKRNSIRANTEQVVGRLDNFITSLFSGAAEVTEPPSITVTPRLLEAETISDAILRLRNEIGRARAEITKVRNAPLPRKEIKAAIVSNVDAMANEGKPRLSIDGTGVRLHWPDVQMFAAPGQALAAPSGSASRLMAWLHRDAIIAELTAGLVDSPGAISSTERPGRIRDLEQKLFALEVEEEHFVTEAIAAGLECHRRPDASPWAILGWGLAREEVHAEAAE